jgi:hypothetical protein
LNSFAAGTRYYSAGAFSFPKRSSNLMEIGQKVYWYIYIPDVYYPNYPQIATQKD